MKLGLIGCGKMGTALAGGILEAGLCRPEHLFAYDPVPEALEEAAKRFGLVPCPSNVSVVEQSEAVLLCVKPQVFDAVLEQIADTAGRLLISVAAGIRIDRIEEKSGGEHRVIRVMPNTPALVGRGAAGYALGSRATVEDADLAASLLQATGIAKRVEESDLDAVTAVSGSGPAYFFLMIEALVAAGVEQGLDPETAHDLAVETMAGAAELLRQTGDAPATLRENVTSPGGTTFAALESFRADAFEQIVHRAVRAARERSIELGSRN